MKRIQFIAPVESIRGNMSGNQVLKYAEHDNPAYESPRGQVNYARNYRPSFIGARRAKDGLTYFAVKTKTAVNMTAKSVQAMAFLGGTGAIVGAILASKSAAPYRSLVAVWEYAKAHGQDGVSLRKFASDIIRRALMDGAQNITATGGGASFSIKNPWYDGSMTTGAQVSQAVLAQFWDQLHDGGLVFTVNGAKGIGTTEDDFSAIVADTNINVLGLTTATVGTGSYVKMGNGWLYADDDYVASDALPVAGKAYVTTSVAPEE